jgi:O-antigen ligase
MGGGLLSGVALPLAASEGPLPGWLRVSGIIAVAAFAALAVLAVSPRRQALATLATLIMAPILLVAEIWSTPQFEALRSRPGVMIAALVVAAAALWWMGTLFARRPQAFAVAAVAALPFRVPVESAGSTANLLVPLYVVIGAGALGWLVPRLRADAVDMTARRRLDWLAWLLIGSVVLYALQAAYSSNAAEALEQVVFFYAPFALLFARLRSLPWTPRLLAVCLGVLVALAVVFAAIGYVEYATRHLLLNPKVIASNQIEEYFRVNSLFFDPNIYGRFLVVVILGLAAVLIWSERPRLVLAAAAGIVVLAGGLLLTLSQSSFAALLVGLIVLALLRWRVRRTVWAVASAVVLAGILALTAAGIVGLDLQDRAALDRATSGRLTLIDGGIRLAAERPVVGWGSGSFATEFRSLEGSSTARATAASHTIPVTIAAEQGLIGLALYLALMAVALARLLKGAGARPARAAIAAAFVALVAHTWMYAAFLEDPMTWALLGIGTALAPAPAARASTDSRPAARPAHARISPTGSGPARSRAAGRK